jgi:hypothetical protein
MRLYRRCVVRYLEGTSGAKLYETNLNESRQEFRLVHVLQRVTTLRLA